MAAGHNSPQESASTGTGPSRAEPRPRRTQEAQRPLTASERFLARFGAAPDTAAQTHRPRAMNNPASPAYQYPLIELQGDLFPAAGCRQREGSLPEGPISGAERFRDHSAQPVNALTRLAYVDQKALPLSSVRPANRARPEGTRPTTGSGYGTTETDPNADSDALPSSAHHALATAQHTGGGHQ